jgi:hypothetical protein
MGSKAGVRKPRPFRSPPRHPNDWVVMNVALLGKGVNFVPHLLRVPAPLSPEYRQRAGADDVRILSGSAVFCIQVLEEIFE